jgi:ABC-type Mn2+/Zn2+ transport system ATPase subunit/HAMP domain-containing protein
MGIGVIVGLASPYVGLLLSYHLDLAAGASIVLVAVTLFFASFVVAMARQTRRRRSPRAVHATEPSATDPQPLAEPAGVLASSVRRLESVFATRLAIGHGGDPLISGIDLRVMPSGSVALVGANGSGKSTLLRTLAGLLPVVDGKVFVGGRTPGSAPRQVAYLPQTPPVGQTIPVRVVDLVRMARYPKLGLTGRMQREDHESVARAIEAMGLTDLKDEPLRTLSGGQRQRVFLAHVLARNAEVILLDEPTNGLDTNGKDHYADAFRDELERGASLVTATHDLGEALEYDDVVLLAGRVVAVGDGEEVLTIQHLAEAFGMPPTRRGEQRYRRFVVRDPDDEVRPDWP